MITANGYSKEPNMMPEGIVITWSKEMMHLKGGVKKFLQYFDTVMQDEEAVWLQKQKLAPKQDIIYVYIILLNRLYCRLNYVGFETGKTIVNEPGTGLSFSRSLQVSWPRILMAGPVIKCPFKRELRGFQGFRYCTKLF